MTDKKSASPLGAVLTLKSKGRRGVVGATIGADGAGEQAYLIEGTPEQAEQWARGFIHDLEKTGHIIQAVSLVRAEEGYSGIPIFHVRPGGFVYPGCEQLRFPEPTSVLKRFSEQLAASGIPPEKLRAVVAVTQYLEACNPETREDAEQALYMLINEAKRSSNIFDQQGKTQG